MSCNILLISVKPKYAYKIFEERTKQVELRRVRTRLKKGDIVLVYVTSPEKAFLGFAEVDAVMEKAATNTELKQFWKEVKDYAGISHKEFYQYYKGASVAVGFFLKNIKKFDHPIGLESLKQKISYLRPPQSYRYLNELEYRTILALGGEKFAVSANKSDP
ncbi:EVE domain-containing protein [Aetokthonos hydrillicola Thurmond2011]|jgi:predicted transcriptional regulator|uniref:EVE domain-containing protein n=1 Tax=Aetokthonos hydrillicola Thurmond2011 TaxID=2712845 RepID=A0AAP5I688_9CYAN|nr:EVE domain-containing protein [Aetokthonos hydrillicola]MBO3459462.1 EVE domain-containing protein [Aetokthonos hydrillicola CCALA 1050]MBW4583825.1 EVE domain-containing protein [Aetokthonos hydrillicola CCALA 1050]MDR9895480.1 EVE domain-containing protein [Aetokthonos hydrillicola Thurmond2011]